MKAMLLASIVSVTAILSVSSASANCSWGSFHTDDVRLLSAYCKERAPFELWQECERIAAENCPKKDDEIKYEDYEREHDQDRRDERNNRSGQRPVYECSIGIFSGSADSEWAARAELQANCVFQSNWPHIPLLTGHRFRS